MEKKAEIRALIEEYAHRYWALYQACSDEEESAMIRIDEEIVKTVSQLELDAQRYRKLKALYEDPRTYKRQDFSRRAYNTSFDAAVDALPEPK